MAYHRGLVLLMLGHLLPMGYGQLNYIVNPSSYLEVIKSPPASISQVHVPRRTGAQADAGSPTASRSLPQLSRQASTRTSAPYKVCVSDWLPMVRCTPDTPQEEYEGKPRSTSRWQTPLVCGVLAPCCIAHKASETRSAAFCSLYQSCYPCCLCCLCCIKTAA